MEQEDQISEKTRDWLLKEEQRLEALRGELSQAGRIMKRETEMLQSERAQFEQEKENFRRETRELTAQIRAEKEKLKEEASFFDKKFKILEMGFAALDADKKTFESQKRAFEYKQKFEQDGFSYDFEPDIESVAGNTYFFRGVSHHLALKKRYKELIKIYHPDNLDGDKSALQQINREFEQMKQALSYQKKA